MEVSFKASNLEELLDGAAILFYALAEPHQQDLNARLQKLREAEPAPAKQVSLAELPKQPAPAPMPVAHVQAPAQAPASTVPVAPPVPTSAPPMVPAQAPAPAPVVPVAAEPAYSIEQVSIACVGLCDMGKRDEVLGLIQQYGVPAITELKPEQINPFVIAIRALGAAI